MLLSEDIIFDNLAQKLKFRYFGVRVNSLHLLRPKLYIEDEAFLKDHLYIAMANHLPDIPYIETGVLLICVGGYPSSAYYNNGKCCVCLVDGEEDIFAVFNMVQDIFDKYDQWDEELSGISLSKGSLQEMINASDHIFENPIRIMDEDFHYIAWSRSIDTREELAEYRPDSNCMYPINNYFSSITGVEASRDTHESMVSTASDGTVQAYFSNLYCDEKFVGVVTILFAIRPYHDSDPLLGDYLRRHLERAFGNLKSTVSRFRNPLVKEIKNLLNGMPVSTNWKKQMSINKNAEQYICLKIAKTIHSAPKIPMEYLITQIETQFPESLCFEYDGCVVVFLKGEMDTEKVQLFLQNMDLIAGISYPFYKILNARYYYREASIALEMGEMMNPDRRMRHFAEYVLRYMVFGCVGELPLSCLMPPGLTRLYKHDVVSQTSYIETLKVYLDNNMNMAQTARELYVHRSTLVERLKNIETLLGMDLKNADSRLQLSLILKIRELDVKENQERSFPPLRDKQ
ncbi:MAG: helix-turn-helix domain-containing protein [Clostridiales bacterium]|nr:helix-turn-helix domain-containing protein [Clostridiales bacterium]